MTSLHLAVSFSFHAVPWSLVWLVCSVPRGPGGSDIKPLWKCEFACVCTWSSSPHRERVYFHQINLGQTWGTVCLNRHLATVSGVLFDFRLHSVLFRAYGNYSTCCFIGGQPWVVVLRWIRDRQIEGKVEDIVGEWRWPKILQNLSYL